MLQPVFDFHLGDALEVLRTLPTESVHCIVTSPPYFNLRDYERDGQIGLETTPGAYISALVDVFREARRVLRKDGTLWVNLGDTYNNKQILGIPARVALALQADGWYWRAENVWEKPNGAPESAQDRPSRTHETVFLFSRSRHYFYDKWAVREENASPLSKARQAAIDSGEAEIGENGSVRFPVENRKKVGNRYVKGRFVSYNLRGRNLRSVWRIPIRPFFPKSVGITDVEHFAVMSPDLAERCILLSTPAGGCCAGCGKPFRRVVTRSPETDTWTRDCSCADADIAPATVLDMFGGAGTTITKSTQLGRSGVYIDLNPDYLRLGQARHAAAVNLV